jgi:ribonuclease P/MRP protein subunit POP5
MVMKMSSDLQTLPSSLREKHRYIVFELLSDEQHELGAVVDAVWETTLNLLGEKGVADANPWLLKDLFDVEQQRGAIRVNKDHVSVVRAALALITRINGVTTTVQVLGVTGTVDSAEEKYLS